MRSRGKKALDTSKKTKSNGKLPCTASVDPVLSASVTEIDPKPAATVAATTATSNMPATPPSTSSPKILVTPKYSHACRNPNAAAPATLPTSNDVLETGDAINRS